MKDPDPIGTSLLWLFGIAVALIVLLVVLARATFAHSWYDPWCCNERDCAPIPFRAVEAGPDGWIVTLEPGDHPIVQSRVVHVVPYADMRPSQDGDFHACILHDKGAMRCFYGFVGG